MSEIDFATSGITAMHRIDAWRAALADVFGPFEVQPSPRGSFSGHVRCFRRAQVQFNEIYYCWQTGERTAANIAGLREENYLLTRPVLGPLRVERNGEEYLLTPGYLYLFDQSLPFRYLSEAGYQAYSVSVPAAALRLREPKIGPIYKVALEDGSPRGQLLRHYVDYLGAGARVWSDIEAVELSERLFDLIVLLIVHEGKSYASESDTTIKAAHRERAIAYIKSHLADCALDPERIAGATGLSVSYLHQVFAAGALKVEDFIYAQRLEKCRALLADPSQRRRSISQLAYQVGFRHPSHFSRLFKARYGVTPREFRAQGD
ncbi:MAG: helix-turn-helix domain-containing protein [Sulfurifustis sp.]